MRSKSTIFRRFLALGAAITLFSPASSWAANSAGKKAQPAGGKAAAASKKKASPAAAVRNKRLPWTTLQTAFQRAQLRERLLQQQILRLQRALKREKDTAKQKKIKKRLQKLTQQFKSLSVAMDVIFAAGPWGRQYVYNPVDSSVYLRIGRLPLLFARAVNVRDRLAKYIGEQQALKEAEKDKKKQEKIQKQVDAASRQWRVLTAALQVVFGIVPQRSYQYDPKSSMLYLMVSDQEIKKLQSQLKALQKKRQTGKQSKPANSATAPAKKKTGR